MSGTTKKKQPKRIRKPKSRATVDDTSGIIGGDDKDEAENPLATKIVFLGKENLEKIQGYQAFLDLWPKGQLCLTITGLNSKSALTLFESINKMKYEEIHGE